MKPKTHTLIIVLALTAISICAKTANAQVIVNFNLPPAYQFKIEYFWKVSLMNPTQATYQVYMIGRATERTDGRVVEATTAKFTLAPGLKIVNGRELTPLDVKEYNSKYSKVVKNIGTVPTGLYDACVSVYNALDNSLLGEMCVESNVQNLTQIELLQPENGARFSEQLIVPKAQNVTSLKTALKEMPEGMDAKRALQLLLTAAYPGIITTPDTSKPEEPVESKVPGALQGGNPFLSVINGLKDPAAFLKALTLADDPWILLDILTLPVRGSTADGSPPYIAAIITTTSTDEGDDWPPTGCCPPPVQRLGIAPSTSEADGGEGAQPIPGGVMTFSWLPLAATPAGTRVTYSLRIAEMVGRQSPYDAIYSNPGVIVLQKIQYNIVQLPLAARRLRPGNYAWEVDVYLNNVLVQKSDVRHFFIEEDVSASKVGTKIDDYGPVRSPRIRTDNYIPFDHKSKNNFSHQTTLSPLFASLLTDPEYLRGSSFPPSNQEPSVAPFAFTGSARFDAQYADRVGSYSETPKNHLTADLRPGVMLYGLPFAGNFMYSTLQDVNKQSMNSFGINFDFEAMRQGLESRLQQSLAEAKDFALPGTDQLKELESRGQQSVDGAKNFSSMSTDQLTNIASPSMLASNLEQYSSISGAEKLFMSIRTLGIGTNYPSYSEYVLSGVPVTGVNLELNPGIFYTAFTASKNQRPIDNSAYRRDLYSGRLGVGKKENTHLFFTGLYVSDDAASIRLDTANKTLTPRENYVFGMEGKLNLFDEHLALEGEGAMSLFTRDTRDPEFASSAIPNFVKNLTKPRLSSSVDYMYTGRIAYTNPESATKISAGLKMIGPGYTSLGVPNLRTDQFGYETKLDQQFFNRRVTLGSFFRMYNDNLIDWKSSTTTMMAYGVNLGFNFPRLPYLRVSYSPISQKNNASDPLYKSETNMLMASVMTGYSYSIGSINASSSFAYSGQKTVTDSAVGDYKSNSFMLSEMLSFSFPLSIGLNLGLIESRTALGYGLIRTADINGSMPLGEIATVGVGVNLASDRNRNERIGFYADYSLSVKEGLDFNLRLEKTNYSDFLLMSDTYREFLGTLGITARW